MDVISLLERAVSLEKNKSQPEPDRVVEALLKLEKDAKKKPIDHSFAELIGCWNLRFITGTKKTRKKAGIILGAGKYIPKFIGIKITYQGDSAPTANTGRVKNSVRLASVELSLTGPAKLLARNNIMAFDFTAIKIVAFGLKLYDNYIRNGAERETKFDDLLIKDQAFFNYFYISENIIAARGKGGGLALWSREK